MNKTFIKTLMGSTIIAGSITGAASIAPAASAQASDEVIVTGSRIARKELVSTSPVNVISTEDIQISGINTVATLLNELPQAGVPGSTDTSTNFSTSGTGLNTIDLRNLGTQRTLVLVNGRRHIGGASGSPTVDVSMIPASLVERVEVVTGGASAVYGSEAVAGVINFIYKDDIEGIEVDVRKGDTQEGGAGDFDISLTAGSNFANDRGNAVIYMGYSDREVLKATDRALSRSDATNSTFGPKGNFLLPGVPGVEATDTTAEIAAIPAQVTTLNESTGLWDKPFVASEDGFDRNARRLIRVPSKRTQFNANFTYDINENIEFFSETGYSQLTSESSLEPSIVGEFISVGSVANIRMPLSNPFVPTELRDAALARDPDATEISMFRRFTEIGNRSSDVQRQAFRTAAGFKGAMSSNFDYEVYAQYGLTTQDQTNGGVFNALNVLQALDTEADPNNVGGFRCADQIARDLGCVPVNFFGENSVSGEALDWVQVDSQLTSRSDQIAAGAFITGDLFELPAGAVSTAFGVDYRKDESKFNSDSLAASGLTSGNTIPNTQGEIEVMEVFGEAIIPLITDKPFIQELTLELAGRYADYTTRGGNALGQSSYAADSYKIAGSWRPVDDLKIRGGYNTAVRAPNINELFDPGSETFRSFNDPCALGGVGGPSANTEADDYTVQSATVQANCATIPGTATLDPASFNIQSAGGLAAGNPDLNPETGKTTTIGFVYSPSQVPGLNFTVDYFDIQIDDAINSFTAQTTADQCVRQPSFPNNPFCALIERNPTTGLVNRINALAINVATFEAAGVDFAADYKFDYKDIGFGWSLNGTVATKNDFVPFEGGETVDSLGEIGVPELKVNSTLIADWNDFRFGWSLRYLDEVNIENDRLNLGTVDQYFYNDVYGSYDFGDAGQYTLYGGVDNLFDELPPELGQGVPGDVTGTNTAADVYDVYGRAFFVGARAKF